ncbi:helix-turn-helix domain-containing protein [Paremcibacter congregatus]|uniref:Cytoskeleton protein RodZ-like C-terminal domain-containing protein n=1 Tax=Paremcibacter congregatus TaxID=2043170 RepID=A0A2G4YPN8_9PROT|nr:helix-turn-helix domain-containing protein [Paremcibacter congregatus]PHZ84278.1 hypothetical protein CRD36_13915 [Paremcibacter congregatus]QDE28987.1 helix-turn-helix domain-containing protein [Paremcibacter congregatus]
MNHNLVLEEDINQAGARPEDVAARVTVGQKLMQAREEKGALNLAEISQELCIRPHLLAALEQDDFNKFPSACYASGFLKNYAAYLGLNVTQIVAQYQKEYNGSSKKVDLKFIEVEKTHNYGQMMTLSFIVLSLLALYGVWHAMGQKNQMMLSALPEMSDVASNILAQVAETTRGDSEIAQVNIASETLQAETIQIAAVQEKPVPAPVVREEEPEKQDSHFTLMQQAQATPLDAKVRTPVADQVRLSVTQDSWVRVISAEKDVLVDRILLAGEEFYMADRAGMTLMTSNAGAVSLFVGAVPVSSLGKAGEIRHNISLDKADLLTTTARLSH